MQADATVTKLKALEVDLRAQGVCGLHLFGSLARGEATPTSDVDLMFDIDPEVRFSLFDQARLMRELSDALQAKVDLVPRRSLHPIVKAKAEAERIAIFG